MFNWVVPGISTPSSSHLWCKPTLSHKTKHSQLKTKFLVLSPALVLCRAGHVANLNLDLDLNFGSAPVFAPKNLLAICWRLAWAKISFVVIRPAAAASHQP